MASEAQSIGHELLRTGLLVGFRIIAEEVLTAPDEAKLDRRLELKFVVRRRGGNRRMGRTGILFVLGLLSFADAKPRNLSVADYSENDDLRLADVMERLRFVRGELHFDADYIRGKDLCRRSGRRYGKPEDHRSWQGGFVVARAHEGKAVSSSGRGMTSVHGGDAIRWS